LLEPLVIEPRRHKGHEEDHQKILRAEAEAAESITITMTF
jgi:hypothetical protein